MREFLITCVCLTTHPKRARFLPDALRSYRQQTWARRELLVVNDGEPLVAHAPDVRVVNLPTRDRRWSVGEKRNVGIRYAQGEYLATWDDDDVSLPTRLTEQAQAALVTGADLVLGDAMYVANDALELQGNCVRRAGGAVMASALVRRSAAVAMGGYADVDYLEDAGLLERMRYVGRGLVITLPGCRWYILRRHGSNITLDAGETHDKYTLCAARDPEVRAAAVALAALRAGPGEQDVTGVEHVG